MARAVLGIIGASGSGKTTLLRCLNGLERIDGGAIEFDSIRLEPNLSAAEYSRRPFRVLGYEEYLDLLCDFIERLDPRIVIERMFGEAPLGLLVAPNWRRTKNDLVRDIQRKFEERDVWQGAKAISDFPQFTRTTKV